MRAFTMTVELLDGTVLEVRTSLRDATKWEATSRKHKWGPIGENLALWEAFLAWSALDRAGTWSGTFDQFLDAVAQVTSAVVPVPPTPPAPPADST